MKWWPDLFGSAKIRALEIQLKAIETFIAPQLTATLSAQVFGRGGFSPPIYPDWSVTQAANNYVNQDQVYAVINKIAETTSLIPFYVYYVKEEKRLRELYTLTTRIFYTNKGLFDILMLRRKALMDAPEADPLVMLLTKPNQFQSQQEFFLSLFCYYLLYGECFIYKYRPDMGANSGRITELYSLSPGSLVVHVTQDYPQSVTGYEFVVNGVSIYKQIPPEDIIHIKKFNPETTSGFNMLNNYARFRGLSPLVPVRKLLTRLTASDDVSVAQLQNGGIPGIVYDAGNEDAEITALHQMKNDFYRYVKSADNKGVPLFTSGKDWKFLQMGLKLTDMEVIKLQEMDFKRLCNIYKISTILFNSEAAATESNVKEMVKQMYTNVCLPLAYTFRDKFNSELVNEIVVDNNRRYIDVDISGITELQDDYKQIATLLADLPITPTGNEMRELFKWDKIENELMDIPLIKSGYDTIDSLTIPMPING